jgi:plastocyanin
LRRHPGSGAAHRAAVRSPLALGILAAWALALPACSGGSDTSLRPDSLLRAELGLTDADQVHRVAISGGSQETLSALSVEIAPGAWVEFVTLDWRVHEIRFESDSLPPEARAFLERTDQVASHPLLTKDERFVLSFEGAPDGRYPFVVEGNGAPARGVVVVRSKR